MSLLGKYKRVTVKLRLHYNGNAESWKCTIERWLDNAPIVNSGEINILGIWSNEFGWHRKLQGKEQRYFSRSPTNIVLVEIHNLDRTAEPHHAKNCSWYVFGDWSAPSKKVERYTSLLKSLSFSLLLRSFVWPHSCRLLHSKIIKSEYELRMSATWTSTLCYMENLFFFFSKCFPTHLSMYLGSFVHVTSTYSYTTIFENQSGFGFAHMALKIEAQKNVYVELCLVLSSHQSVGILQAAM